MQHVIKLSETFQVVDKDVQKRLNLPHHRWQQAGAKHEPHRSLSKVDYRTQNDFSRKIPVRAYVPHKAKALRHYLKDCTAYSEKKKKPLLRRSQKGRPRRDHRGLPVLEKQLQNRSDLRFWCLTNKTSLDVLIYPIRKMVIPLCHSLPWWQNNVPEWTCRRWFLAIHDICQRCIVSRV